METEQRTCHEHRSSPAQRDASFAAWPAVKQKLRDSHEDSALGFGRALAVCFQVRNNTMWVIALLILGGIITISFAVKPTWNEPKKSS